MKTRKPIFNRWPALLAVVLLVPGGCQPDEPVNPGGDFTPRDVEVSAKAVMKSIVPECFWEEGDLFSVYTTGASTNSNLPFSFSSLTEYGLSGNLAGTIHQTATGTHKFTAVFPYYENAASNPANYAIVVPGAQNVSTESIDPSTFVLVSAPVEMDVTATGGVSIGEMDFTSPLAFVKIMFTNQYPYFESGETITSVRFSAPASVDLAGRALYDLTEGDFVEVVSGNQSRIDAFYPENAGPSAADNFTCWFTAFPFAVQAGGQYTITITTDMQTLTGTFTAEEWLSFDSGVVTTLDVTIDVTGFETDAPLEEQWGKIISASDVDEGNYVIAGYVNSNWMAMSNKDLVNAQGNPLGVVIALSPNGGALAEDPSGDIVWNFTGDNSSGFTVSSDVPTYLYADPAAAVATQALTFKASDPGQKWLFSNNSSDALGMKPYGGSAFVSPYHSGTAGYDWRSYTYYNPTFSLFKEGVLAPAPRPTVVSGAVSGVTLSTVTFNGSFSNPTSFPVESAGFAYGTTTSMGSTVDAAIDGNSFSASLTGLPQGTKYYYRAFVVINGARYEGSAKSFRTALPGPAGKTWLELPDTVSGTGMTAKTYYAAFEKPVAKQLRNYSILYDPSQGVALWVAFPMNASTHLGDYTRQQLEKWSYDNDGDIPTADQPAIVSNSYTSYTSISYHRGHQLASADRDGALEAGRQTYYVTNMTPQNSSLNSGAWGSLEDAIRKKVALAETTPPQDTLYIVTGPVMPANPTVFVKDNNGDDFPVPGGYFKVILWSKYYEGGERKYDSVGFYFENRSYVGTPFENQARSVSSVEQMCGYSFFDNLGLSPSQMTAIKSTSSWTNFTDRATSPAQ